MYRNELEKQRSVWHQVASIAAPLGTKAIGDEICRYQGGTSVQMVEAICTPKNDIICVTISFRDKENPEPLLTEKFNIYVGDGVKMTWTEARNYVDRVQDNLPVHLAGYRINVDEDTYMHHLAEMRLFTGYCGLNPGDIWVHKCEKAIHIGAVTRAGQIAFTKYCEIKGLEEAFPTQEQKSALADMCLGIRMPEGYEHLDTEDHT